MDWVCDIGEMLGLKYSIRDPIHGFIHFNEWEKSIIDHPWFQRLRRIRQLAFTEYVYPGATHTRFEHSLGVMHLATSMFLRIISKCRKDLFGYLNSKEPLTKTKFRSEVIHALQMLRIAALLHDVGHGPFSHAMETVLPRDPSGAQYTHEDYSYAATVQLKDRIDGSRWNTDWAKRAGCEKVRAQEVASLLVKRADIKAKVGRLWPLARTLLNSQLDADRLDYLLRDSHYAGVKYGVFDLERVLEALTFCVDYPDKQDATPEIMLALEEADFEAAESVVLARHRMNTMVYFHKTRRIFDLMLAQAMPVVLGKKGGALPAPDEVGAYLDWDDGLVHAKLLSVRDKSQVPLSGAIHGRVFPRLAGTSESDSVTKDLIRALEEEGFAVATDKDLSAGPPQVWVDTGVAFTTYKSEESLEIRLRPSRSVGTGRFKERLKPISLSEDHVLLKLWEALKSTQHRVYLTGVKQQREKVAAIIRDCGGVPWEG